MQTVKDESNATAIYILLGIGLVVSISYSIYTNSENERLRKENRTVVEAAQTTSRSREEASELRRRVTELEKQNRALTEAKRITDERNANLQLLNNQLAPVAKDPVVAPTPDPWAKYPLVNASPAAQVSKPVTAPAKPAIQYAIQTPSVSTTPSTPSVYTQDRTSSYTSSEYRSTTPRYMPPVAENGDRRGMDNDGDGRAEPVYVNGYYRKDGTYVRGHYRASPSKR